MTAGNRPAVQIKYLILNVWQLPPGERNLQCHGQLDGNNVAQAVSGCPEWGTQSREHDDVGTSALHVHGCNQVAESAEIMRRSVLRRRQMFVKLKDVAEQGNMSSSERAHDTRIRWDGASCAHPSGGAP